MISRKELGEVAVALAMSAVDEGLDREEAVLGLFTGATLLACSLRSRSGVALFIEELAADLRALDQMQEAVH